jgi:exopolysaccharide biosynthesis polyprenyl glycosylphosphotransferase
MISDLALEPLDRARIATRPRLGQLPLRGVVGVCGVLGDISWLLVAGVLISGGRPWGVPAFVVGTVFALAASGQYRVRLTLGLGDGGRVVGAVAAAFVTVAVVGGFGPTPIDALALVPAGAGFLVLDRLMLQTAVRHLRVRGLLLDPTLVVGAGDIAVRLAETLAEHPEFGLVPVGFVDDIDSQEHLPFPVLGRAGDLADILARHRVRRVVIAFGVARESAMVEVVRACEDASVEIHVLPRFFELGFSPRGRDVDLVLGYPLVRLPRNVLQARGRLAKRVLDVVVAALLLALASPVFAALALAVKLTSPGPVFFRQLRVGERSSEVEILKFRSMRINTDSDTTWSVDCDSRVTPLGRFIRSTSLDELPQLWNVLRGDMSLVGPRPERPVFVDQFGLTVRAYDQRHRVPVGLTGLSQVNGLRGDTSIDERARLDNHYIENWSLRLDLAILIRTVPTMVGALVPRRPGAAPGTTSPPPRAVPAQGWSLPAPMLPILSTVSGPRSDSSPETDEVWSARRRQFADPARPCPERSPGRRLRSRPAARYRAAPDTTEIPLAGSGGVERFRP